VKNKKLRMGLNYEKEIIDYDGEIENNDLIGFKTSVKF
jgi:hypothetical protein